MKSRTALWIVLLVALAARLYLVSAPLTDGGQERQTQVSMIARNLYRENMNILYPRMDIFAPEPGYVMLEFPLQSALMAVVYYIVGIKDIVGRLITIGFSMGSIIFVYLLSQFFLPRKWSLVSSSIYALTPMSIYFGRAVFPEALLMFFSLGSVYFLLRWSEESKFQYYVWSLIFAAISFLVKAPPGLSMILPLGAIWWIRWRCLLVRRIDFYIYFGLSIIPILLWIYWSTKIGGQDAGWNVYQVSTIDRLGIPGVWFNQIFYLKLFKSLFLVTLTPIVFIFSVVGLVKIKNHRLAVLIYAWAISMVVYVLLTAGAQMSHWNYQVPLIPLGAILATIGIYGMANNQGVISILGELKVNKIIILGFIGVSGVLAFGYIMIYSAVVREAYNISKRVPYAVEVGKIVQKEMFYDGFVMLIQPMMVATCQTYYMDRKVRVLSNSNDTSPVTVSKMEFWRAKGAIGVVAVDTPYGSGTEIVRSKPDLLAYLRSNYRIVRETDHYLIYSLR
jgi:4-amino-4-deoxy-L-arabinose transferase-like glycosyltransferase